MLPASIEGDISRIYLKIKNIDEKLVLSSIKYSH